MVFINSIAIAKVPKQTLEGEKREKLLTPWVYIEQEWTLRETKFYSIILNHYKYDQGSF